MLPSVLYYVYLVRLEAVWCKRLYRCLRCIVWLSDDVASHRSAGLRRDALDALPTGPRHLTVSQIHVYSSGEMPTLRHCRLGRTADTVSRLTIELPFHLPPQRRPTPGPGIVPIVTDAQGRRLIRFSVPIGPEFTVDEVAVEVDSAARQVRAISAVVSRRITMMIVMSDLHGKTDRQGASLTQHID